MCCVCVCDGGTWKENPCCKFVVPMVHAMLPAGCTFGVRWHQSTKHTSLHNNTFNDVMLGNVVLGCTQDAKELLYRLFKAGFVGLQDVPRTADHAPSRTLYTWSVNNEAAADKLAAELYKAAFNVYVRCTNEFEQHKEVSHMGSHSQSLFVNLFFYGCIFHFSILPKRLPSSDVACFFLLDSF